MGSVRVYMFPLHAKAKPSEAKIPFKYAGVKQRINQTDMPRSCFSHAYLFFEIWQDKRIYKSVL